MHLVISIGSGKTHEKLCLMILELVIVFKVTALEQLISKN